MVICVDLCFLSVYITKRTSVKTTVRWLIVSYINKEKGNDWRKIKRVGKEPEG